MGIEDLDPATIAEIAALVEKGRRRKEEHRSLTIRQLWDEWYPAVATKTHAPNIRSHRGFLEIECRLPDGTVFKLGNIPWSEAVAPHFVAWQAAMAAIKGTRGHNHAPSYRDRVRQTLQSCFTYHVNTDKISRNPLRGIPMNLTEKQQPKRQGYYTEEQFTAVCKYLPAVAIAQLRTMRRCGGMRASEVANLRVSDIDHPARKFLIRNAKGGIQRLVIIPDDFYPFVKAWADSAVGTVLFPSPKDPNKRVPDKTFISWMQRAAKKSGVRLFSDEAPIRHACRHTHAVELMENDADIHQVAHSLGCTVEVAAKRYGHVRGKLEDQLRQLQSRGPRLPNYPCPTCRKDYPGPREAAACLDSHEAAG